MTALERPRGRLARSFLYVPADRPDRLAHATARGADALILDLEDAVPLAAKDSARTALSGWLGAQSGAETQLWVRINPPTAASDISAVVTPGLAGVLVPKATVALLSEVDCALADREGAAGVPVGTIRIIPLIETAESLIAVAAIAGCARVDRLGLGEADLCAELGLRPQNGAEVMPLRLQLVVASAAAGIGRPVAPASLDFRDLPQLRASTEALFRLGFRARTAIHPAQIPTINEVFTPSADEISMAHRLLQLFESAQQAGVGVIVDEHGRMVDLAVVRGAREVLALAGQAGYATAPAAPA